MADWDNLTPSDLVAGEWLKRSLDNAATAQAAADAAQADADTHTDTLAAIGPGAVPVAMLVMSSQPTAADTVTIGADVYEFLAAGGDTAAETNIAVLIGGSAGITQQNLIDAINAVNATNEHATIFNGDGSTPAVANGTENVVADAISTSIRIRSADEPGGTVVAADPSIVLAESITAAADVWDVGAVNLNTLGGAATAAETAACSQMAITAAMVTAGSVRFGFPFTVTRFMAQVRTAAGVLRAPVTDSFAIANGDVKLTLTSSDASDVDATDIVTVIAWP